MPYSRWGGVARPGHSQSAENPQVAQGVLAGSCSFAPERAVNLQKKWHTADTAAFGVRSSQKLSRPVSADRGRLLSRSPDGLSERANITARMRWRTA